MYWFLFLVAYFPSKIRKIARRSEVREMIINPQGLSQVAGGLDMTLVDGVPSPGVEVTPVELSYRCINCSKPVESLFLVYDDPGNTSLLECVSWLPTFIVAIQ